MTTQRPELEQLAELVSATRQVLGLTQLEMADRMGISRSQVANAEAGRTDLGASRIVPLLIEAGTLAPDLDRERVAARAVRWNIESAAITALHRALDEASAALAELERARRGGP